MRVEYCFSLFMIESFLIRLPNIFEVFCCWWFYFSFLFWCHLHHQQQRIGASVEDKIVYIYISTVECCRKERRLKCRAETTMVDEIEENLDSRPRIREEKKAVFPGFSSWQRWHSLYWFFRLHIFDSCTPYDSSVWHRKKTCARNIFHQKLSRFVVLCGAFGVVKRGLKAFQNESDGPCETCLRCCVGVIKGLLFPFYLF